MARLATLGGEVAGRLQATLYFARKKRRGREAAMPSNTVAPAITGTTTVGQQLSCSTGTWTGSPAGYKYVWRRAGGGSEAIISGATASTYTLVSADLGKTITCTVTAINENGFVGKTSAAVGPVA